MSTPEKTKPTDSIRGLPLFPNILSPPPEAHGVPPWVPSIAAKHFQHRVRRVHKGETDLLLSAPSVNSVLKFLSCPNHRCSDSSTTCDPAIGLSDLVMFGAASEYGLPCEGAAHFTPLAMTFCTFASWYVGNDSWPGLK